MSWVARVAYASGVNEHTHVHRVPLVMQNTGMRVVPIFIIKPTATRSPGGYGCEWPGGPTYVQDDPQSTGSRSADFAGRSNLSFATS